MPNWCSTSIRITGPDYEAFDQFVEEAKEKAYLETDFGKNWLGHLLLHAGLPEEEVIHGDLHCRGYIGYKNSFSGCVDYECESAWSPCDDVFQFIKEKKGFDVDIDFFAVEPGCGVYETSDYAFSEGQYYVSCECSADSDFAPLMDGEGSWWEDDLEYTLKGIYGKGSLDEMIEWAEEEDDVWISINRIDLVA